MRRVGVRAFLAFAEANLTARLARMLCDKIGLLPGGAMNLLLVVVPAESTDGPVVDVVAGAIRLLDAVALDVSNHEGSQIAGICLNG